MTMFGEGSAIALADNGQAKCVGQFAKQVGSKVLFSRKSLLDILRRNCSFPDTNRVILWRFILQLPNNEDIFRSYSHERIHPGVRDLPDRLPMKFNSVLQRLMRLLSTLVYWHPLAECDWLPSLVFPFLQICGRDSIVAFEMVATILCNWCTEWLHFIPNPPITILSRIDHIAQENGGEAPLSVAWPVLRSFCGEIASTKAELMILDNILCAKPVFIEYVVAAYALMKDPVIDEISVLPFLKKAEQLYLKDIQKQSINDAQFNPLPVGHYPVLVIVKKSPMWRENELRRIRAEADATKQQMELRAHIDSESAKIDRHRQKWMGERKVLKMIEEEQMAEYRRVSKQTMQQDVVRESKAIEARRRALTERKIKAMGEIAEWRNDCQKTRLEMEKQMDSTRETWKSWLDLKEQLGALEKEEVDVDMELLTQRQTVQEQETEEHDRLTEKVASEESELLKDVLATNERLEQDVLAKREILEKARARQAGGEHSRQESRHKSES
jgi:hypothetical protein